LGRYGGGRLARELPLLKVTQIRNKGHIMMNASRLIVAGAAIALLPLSAALAQTPTTPPDDQQPAQSAPTPETAPAQQKGATFESLDTNGDGRISKTEAAANESVKSQFSHYDVNGDGFIEKAEVVKANSPPAQP